MCPNETFGRPHYSKTTKKPFFACSKEISIIQKRQTVLVPDAFNFVVTQNKLIFQLAFFCINTRVGDHSHD